MNITQKLKGFEKQIVFLRWATSAEYGKINYVGEDFIEFEVLDPETLEYTETSIINAQLILEMIVGGSDISRIIVELSSRLPSASEQ